MKNTGVRALIVAGLLVLTLSVAAVPQSTMRSGSVRSGSMGTPGERGPQAGPILSNETLALIEVK